MDLERFCLFSLDEAEKQLDGIYLFMYRFALLKGTVMVGDLCHGLLLLLFGNDESLVCYQIKTTQTETMKITP